MSLVSNPPSSAWELYSTATGNELVAAELRNLGTGPSANLVRLAQKYESNEFMGNKLKSLGDGLFELRTSLEGNQYRLIFAEVGKARRVILGVHAFTKKTQKTPPKTLRLARDRRDDWVQRRG